MKQDLLNFRSVFISDVHLGTERCDSEGLLEFIESVQTEYLFLVGDIIDLLELRRKSYWHKNHTKFIRKLLKLAENGKIPNVIYILGNHEGYIRQYVKNQDLEFSRILFCERYIHTSINGGQYLVMHGDQFDRLRHIPDIVINRLGKLIDPFMQYSEDSKKNANNFYLKFHSIIQTISPCEKVAMNKLAHVPLNGIIMGHTHEPKIVPGYNEKPFSGWILNSQTYMNCGSWVKPLPSTFIAETLDGTFELFEFKNSKIITKFYEKHK